MQFYTVSEVANLLRVKKPYIYELIYVGKLSAIKLSERRIRISSDALENFIKENNANSAGYVEAAGK